MTETKQETRTVQEIMSDVRKTSGKTRLVMNDVPLWLHAEFDRDVKARYNNAYWVKLMVLMEKAKAYDRLFADQLSITEEDVIPEGLIAEEKPKKKTVETMGGTIEYG